MLEEALTYRERLELARIRQRLTRAAYSASLGVSVAQYEDWMAGNSTGPAIYLGGLWPWEHYTALRVRYGIARIELSRRIGCCPRYIRMMEYGERPIKRLREYWRH